MEIVLILLGVAAGVVIGFLVGRLRAQELASAAQVSQAQLEAERERHQSEVAGLQERLEEQRKESEERMQLIAANRQQLTAEMRVISGDAMKAATKLLEENLEQRRKLEREQAKNELDRRSAEIKNAVNPVKETLTEVKTKVEQLERQRIKAQSELGQQLDTLRQGVDLLADSAGGLSAALRKPSGRGSWGELQLRNVIELAGMIEHCDFETQVTVQSEDGLLRPDVIVNMPGGKTVVVDAKVPMEAFLEAQEATDEDVREEHLRKHATQVRRHVDALRAKSYQQQFETSPELVVMFIPSEGIYHAALSADPRLLEHGLQERVLIATPTTLIGLLRAINYGWGQQRIAESAQEIASLGRELHKRLATFSGHLGQVGKSLNTAVDRYNKAIASYDTRVVPHLRKIEDAGAGSGRELPEMNQVEKTPRAITNTSTEDHIVEGVLPGVPEGMDGKGRE